MLEAQKGAIFSRTDHIPLHARYLNHEAYFPFLAYSGYGKSIPLKGMEPVTVGFFWGKFRVCGLGWYVPPYTITVLNRDHNRGRYQNPCSGLLAWGMGGGGTSRGLEFMVQGVG